MGTPLAQPPLVEALVEFRFAPDDWDWTIPGRLYEKIKQDFPERVEVRPPMFVLGQSIGPGGPPPPPAGTPERLQFKRANGTAMVQVGPGLLVVNHLRPYPNWPEFRRLVSAIYTQYRGLSERSDLERLGIRYINHFPLDKITLTNDVPVIAPIAKTFGMEMKSFFQKFELQGLDAEGTLVHHCGTFLAEGRVVLVIDLDFFSTEVRKLGTLEDIETWLDRAHDVIENAFVKSMSEKLYERLRLGG